MAKYWLKNRSIFDFAIGLLLSIIFAFAFVFPTNNNCQNIANQNHIYLNTQIDFQIPNPSIDQLNEIEGQSFVEKSFGYYMTKTNVNSDISFKTNILMTNDWDNLSITMFNQDTIISSCEKTSNYAFVDKKVADNLNVKVGSSINFTIAGKSLTYIVCSIYMENKLFNEGAIMVDFSGELKNAYESSVSSNSYSAAFLKASNVSECSNYLKSYIPLGRLKDRSEFESDEAYQTYNNAIKNGSYSNEISNFAEYRVIAKNELSQAKSMRTLMSIIGAISVGLIFIILCEVLRFRTSENKYFRDILKNKDDIKKYRFLSFLCSLLTYLISTIILTIFFFEFSYVLLPAAISLVMFVIGLAINLIQDKQYVKR